MNPSSSVNGRKEFFLQADKGFSLIELLVALTLIGIVFFSALPSSNDQRDNILKNIERLELIIFKAQNEAMLRSTICRLLFKLDSVKQSYQLECSNETDLTLLPFDEILGIEAEKLKQKKLKEIDKKFSKLEGDEGNATFEGDLKIIGIGLEGMSDILIDGNVSIHFFSDGEKDSSMVFFGTGQEVMGLSIPAYNGNTKLYSEETVTEIIDQEELFKHQEEIANELFSTWKSE